MEKIFLIMFQVSEYGVDISFITFIIYAGCVLCTIFGYCYIGECLITEVIIEIIRIRYLSAETLNMDAIFNASVKIYLMQKDKQYPG